LQHNKSYFYVEPVGRVASLYLDGLRAIFSQLVLIGHAASYFGVLPFIEPPHFPWIQSIAVVGFFWLSGFLICHSTLMHKQKTQRYCFADFFFRRFARIYSAYVPAILFVFLIDLVFIRIYPEKYTFYSSFSLTVAIKNLFMLQKFPVGFATPMFGSASTWWSLAIEWWLYMFFGLLYFRRSIKLHWSIYWVVLCFVSLIPLEYAVKNSGVGIGLTLLWLLGCVIAVTKDIVCKYVSRKTMLFSAFFLVVLAVIRYKVSMDSYDSIASIYLGGGLLFSTCWMQGVKVDVNKSIQKAVHFLASYSFTLFLIHLSILYFISSSGWGHGWGPFIVSIAISNIIAALLAYSTEIHYRRLAIFLENKWYSMYSINN
jgi:peptidoglycan/LPS O-acetylase OafA/YrhL